jgi:hypothetical protein
LFFWLSSQVGRFIAIIITIYFVLEDVNFG